MNERTPLLKRPDEESLEAAKPPTPALEPSIRAIASSIIARLSIFSQFRGLSAEAASLPENDQAGDALVAACGQEALDRSVDAATEHRKPIALEANSTRFACPQQDALVLAGLLWLILANAPAKKLRPAQSVTQALKVEALARQSSEVYAIAVTLILDAAASMMPISNEVETQGKDAIVEMLFRPLPLDEEGRVASVVDLILRLTSVPRTSAIKAIILHPVLAAAVDSAWTHETGIGLTPQCLYGLNSTHYFFYVCLTTAVALTPESAHYYRFNPLQPRCNSLNNPILAILFYIWLLSTLGYFVELCKCMVRGPIPSTHLKRLQVLPPGSFFVLLAHSMVFLGILLRTLSHGRYIIISISYPLLAWAMPLFLLSLFVFPIGLPSLNPFGSRLAPSRFRSLRVLNERLTAYLPLLPFLLISLFILFWAVNGEVESWDPHSLFTQPSLTNVVAPIEARTSLAVSILAVLLLGWFIGDAHQDVDRELDVQVAANLERLRMVRYFSPRQDEDTPLPPMESLLYFIIGSLLCRALALAGDRGQAAGQQWREKLRLWKRKSASWRSTPWIAKRWP